MYRQIKTTFNKVKEHDYFITIDQRGYTKRDPWTAWDGSGYVKTFSQDIIVYQREDNLRVEED